MCGLKNAGRVSKDRLVKHLNSSNFFETETPCLFRHSTRDITFCLVVDDFGIKCSTPTDLSFLVDCSSQLCHVKVHPVGTKCLGFTIEHCRSARGRSISLSYPSYVPSLLQRIRPLGVKLASTPSMCTPPLSRPHWSPATHCPPSFPSCFGCPGQRTSGNCWIYIILRPCLRLFYAPCCTCSCLPATCSHCRYHGCRRTFTGLCRQISLRISRLLSL